MGRVFKLAVAVVGLMVVMAAVLWLTTPDVRPLADRKHNLTIQVRDWKGRYHPLVVGPKNPRWTPLKRISPYLRAAVVAGEDQKFYRHKGFDFAALREAALRDLEERRFAAGGSTITQQLAKNLYLSREKSLLRKLREALIARELERHLSKRRILELYLNVVELGPGVWGAEHGARFYFGKGASALNPKEAAFLAAMLPGPQTAYNPYKNLRRVERRSRKLLRGMLWAGVLTRQEYLAWRAAQVNIKGLERKVEAVTGEPVETTLAPEEAAGPEAPEEALPPEPSAPAEGMPGDEAPAEEPPAPAHEAADAPQAAPRPPSP